MSMGKKCPTCQQVLTEGYFHRNRKRKDGLDWRCKLCKKNNDNREKRQKREQKYYERNTNGRKDKAICRDATRRVYVDAKRYQCAVLSCRSYGRHFHHISYEKPLDVLVLCEKHHNMEHYD